jgi:hypothetical protein
MTIFRRKPLFSSASQQDVDGGIISLALHA